MDQTMFISDAPEMFGMAYLTIYGGTESGAPFSVNLSAKKEFTIGRDANNDIVLNASFVSRRHGIIKRSADGNFILEDCGSTNGMFLDGKQITRRVLQNGDSIKIEKVNSARSDGILLAFSRNARQENELWKTYNMPQKTSIVTIGRGANCDIRLEHISVSKTHAVISCKDGQFYITDSNSVNGVIVNGNRISRPHRLCEKDLIVITNSKLIFSSTQITYCVQRRGIGLDASGIVKKVGRKNKTICNDVDISIAPCELVAIVGGSGAGKSTLMNCLSGYNPPTQGNVFVNGVNLYENYAAIKNIIGYVPQADIVYDNLSLVDMLRYAAKLRLPNDVTDSEISERTNKVIQTVELNGHEATLIKRLSGGQRKRASIAVELLSDPNLFFLDEPMSGLDPGTERNLCNTLKNMASDGKTVVFVTHSTLNLHLCDKVAFMGTGGNLCFYGTAKEATKFFGVDDIVDVYNKISSGGDAVNYKNSFAKTRRGARTAAPHTGTPGKPIHRSFFKQTPVLFRRNFRIMYNDHVRMLLLLLQAPLLGLLISVVANGYQYYAFNITQNLFFALACSAFWVGTLNSIQEICKERVILEREHMAGLRMDAYIVSKMMVFLLVCFIQALGLVGVFAWMVGLPETGVFGDSAFAELFIATFLSAFAASGLGILGSSLFTNADRAMTVAPLLLMPQILFSGIIFELEGAADWLSVITVSRWSVQSYGTTANLNTMDIITGAGVRMEREAADIFEFTRLNIVTSWAALAVIAVLCTVAAVIMLRRINAGRG